MKEFPDKTVGDTPAVMNAAVGSPLDRCPDLPREMQEPAAAPSICRAIARANREAVSAGKARAATRPPTVPQIGPPVGLTGTLGSVGAVDDRDPAIPNPNNLAAALLRQGPALKARGRGRQAQSRALMIGP